MKKIRLGDLLDTDEEEGFVLQQECSGAIQDPAWIEWDRQAQEGPFPDIELHRITPDDGDQEEIEEVYSRACPEDLPSMISDWFDWDGSRCRIIW